MDADRVMCELAERQHGFVLRVDARAAGLSPKAERFRIARGDWIDEGPRLLRRSGAPVTKATPLMRAVLDAGPGAFLSHGTAAAWWGLPGYSLLTIHVTRPRGINGARPLHAHQLHEVLDLSSEQVTVLDGVPIVRPERCTFELFGTEHPMRAARAAETAWAKGLLSGNSLQLIFDQLAGRGRQGTVASREFLDTHPPGWTPPASNIERRFQSLMDESGLGTWRRQVDLGDDRWAGRVDFLSDDRLLVVEVQSERYHSALLDKAHDAARRRRLEAAGFVVVEVWDTEVWHDKAAVIAAVSDGIARCYRRSA